MLAFLAAALAFIGCAAAARDTYLFGGQRQSTLLDTRSLAEIILPNNAAAAPIPYLGIGPVVTGGYGSFGGYGSYGYGSRFGFALAPAPGPAVAPGQSFITDGSDLVRPAPTLSGR